MGKIIAGKIGGMSRWAKWGLVFTLLMSTFMYQGWYNPYQVHAGTLIHSSANLGTKYGTWGTAFTCATCHNPAIANIKLVAPLIIPPWSLTARPVIFNKITSTVVTYMGVMGNDQRTNLSTSTNVCEVCHTKTRYHQYSSSSVTHPQVNTAHKNRNDCTLTCHPHNAGFAVSVTGCTACHGNPPSTTAELVTTAFNYALAPGAHVKHTSYAPAIACVACHQGTNITMTSGDNKVNLGFQINKANWPQYSPPGNSTAASAVVVNSGYAGWLVAAPTTSTTAANTMTCSVYCHAGWTGAGGAQNPVSWATTGPLACNSCHYQTRAQVGAGAPGSHYVHAATTQQNYDCPACHGAAPTTTTHVNGDTKVTFNAGVGNYKGNSNYTSASAKASGAAYGSCTSTVCHGQNTPAAWGTAVTPASGNVCQTCHGSLVAAFNNFSSATLAPGYNNEGRDTGGYKLATDARVGTHQAHLTATEAISDKIHCGECHPIHVTVQDPTHLNYSTATITFGPLAKTASHTTAAATRVGGYINCNNTYCHTAKLNTGVAMTPVWNNANYLPAALSMTACKQCHNMPPNPGVAGAHSGIPAALIAFPVGTTCNCHSNLSTINTTYALIFSDKTKHINGVIDVSGGHAYPYPGASHMVAAGITPWGSCVTTGCHTNTGANTYPVVRGTAPDCKGCHKYNNVGGLKTPSGTSSCYDCHGSTAISGQPNGSIAAVNFPNYSGSHSVHITKAALTCANCHFGFGGGSVEHGFHATSSASRTNFKKVAFNSVAGPPVWVKATTTCTNTCHGSGAVWGGRLKCTDCHNSTTLVRTKVFPNYAMANVVAEFQTGGWSHTKTQGFTVTDEDCIVCHLEGSMSTLAKTAKHGDGNIDLRDHNTATNDVAITDLAGAAITFKRFTTSFAAGSRSSAIVNTSVRDVVTRKFCLGCHKTGGSSNTTAGQGGIAPGGTALKPFGLTSGTVLDINSQFATTNSSRHPVLGPLTKDYPTATRMADPYKPTGTRGTSGTKTAGVIMNCFDCHNVTGTPITHRTVSAHGNAVTIRGVMTGAQPTLCTTCHLSYTGITAGSPHGAGSAFATTAGNTHMSSTEIDTCGYCHSSTIVAVRPVRAQDVHGVNSLPAAGTKTVRWLAGGTNGVPVSFIRNTVNLTNHNPLKVGATSYTPQCDMISGNACTGRAGSPYTPGGTY